MQHMMVGIIRPEELANKMEETCGNLIIADCRSGMEYLTWHISGAVNIGGTRNTRREIMTGKVTVMSVLHDKIGRTCNKEELLVVYDQSSIESSTVQSLAGRVAEELALYFRRVCFLRGGFIGFQSKFPNLCWTNKHKMPDEDFVTPSQTVSVTQSIHDSASVRSVVNAGNQSLTRSHTMITLAVSRPNLSDSILTTSAPQQQPSSISKHPSLLTRHSLSGPALPSGKEGPTTVLPYLLLGTQQDALTQSCIMKHGITHVINVSTDGLMCPFIAPQNFMRIPVLDNFADKITPYFPKAFQFLDDVKTMGGRALVHCSAGISRSPTLAIAYLMKTMNTSVTEAYNVVKLLRTSVSPNFNFMGQLTDYEQCLRSVTDDKPSVSMTTTTGPIVSKQQSVSSSRQKRRPSRLGFLSTLLRNRVSTSPNKGDTTVKVSTTPLLPSPSVPFARLGINSPMDEAPAALRLDHFTTTSLDQLLFQPCQTGPRGIKVKRSATQADNDSSKIRKRLSDIDSNVSLQPNKSSSSLEPDSSLAAVRRHSSVFPATLVECSPHTTDTCSPMGGYDSIALEKSLCLSGRSVSYERINNGSTTGCTTTASGLLTDSCRLQECHQSTSSISSANSHSSNLLV